ncbi:MAG: hypothetical protein J6T01_01495 [Kiritimatiellae bacterium]|nr:hypothetical protein [Kiritimatiellia bacterium]
MRNCSVAAAALAICVAAPAFADVPANAYIQAGLIAQWDGIDNAGRGFGGGVVRVKAAGAIIVNGTISADGEFSSKIHLGSGAGGTILLDCEKFGGDENGLLTARGAKGWKVADIERYACAGGGGRIAVWTGRPWTAKTKPTHWTKSETPIASEKDGTVFLGRVTVDGGGEIVNYTGTSTAYYGGTGTVWFVENHGAPGLKVMLK